MSSNPKNQVHVQQEKTIKDLGISSSKMNLDVHKLVRESMTEISHSCQHLALLEGCLLVTIFPENFKSRKFSCSDRAS